MKRKYLSVLLVLLTGHAAAQALWGSLEKGPYNVGFKVLYEYDFSRPALVDQDLQGKVTSKPAAPARQMQISLWYPTTANAKKMLYQDYIFELAHEIDFSLLTDEKKNASIDKVVALFQDYQQNKSFNQTQLKDLLATVTAASRNARPAPGKFPLPIYPHWFSPMDGSIMSEFLASQGIVVASTSLKGSDSVLPEISPRGLQSVATDISFMINELSDVDFIDISKVAVMGVGINATGCIAAMKDVSTIDAFISLDGGIVTESEMKMFQQTGNVNLIALAKPMLFISAPHPSVNPDMADYFKYADKYFLRFNTMTEYYFLNNGMIETFVPGIIGKPPGDVKAGFEWSARYVSKFLKHALQNDAQALAFLERDPAENGVVKDLVVKSTKKGLPLPPTLHDLKVISAKQGANGLREAYEKLKNVDKQPFTQLVMADLHSWLGFRRDTDFVIRTEWAKIWIESYPNSSRGHFTMARILAAQRKNEEAKTYYQKSLELLANDPDVYLDNLTRERINTVSTQATKE